LTVYKDDVKNNTNTNTNINPLKGEVIFLPINKQSVFIESIESINCYTSQFFNYID